MRFRYWWIIFIILVVSIVIYATDFSSTKSTQPQPEYTPFKDRIIQAGGKRLTVGDSLQVNDAELYLVRIEIDKFSMSYDVFWNVHIDGKGFMGEIQWYDIPNSAIFKNHTYTYIYDWDDGSLYLVEGKIS